MQNGCGESMDEWGTMQRGPGGGGRGVVTEKSYPQAGGLSRQLSLTSSKP